MKIGTKVIGAIEIYLNPNVCEDIIQNFIDNLPIIGNDENHLEYHISQIDKCSLKLKKDCRKCIYSSEIVNKKLQCNSPKDYVCPTGEYKFQYIISLYGHFEDKPPAKLIMNEIKSILKIFEENYQNFSILDYSILINDFREPCTISSHNRYED